jgi:hypothetical protein
VRQLAGGDGVGGTEQGPERAGTRSSAVLWTEFGALIGIFGAAVSVAAFVLPTGSIANKLLLAMLAVSLSALVWRGITLWWRGRMDLLFLLLTLSTFGLVVWYSALVVGQRNSTIDTLRVQDSGQSGGASRIPITSPPSPSPSSDPTWVAFRNGQNVTLADGQTIDFDTGSVGNANTVGLDVGLDERANQLWVPSERTRLALLDTSGMHTSSRCTAVPPSQWSNMIRGVYDLTTGRDICVVTSESRSAIITIDRVPDSIVNTLTFHYTVWERH